MLPSFSKASRICVSLISWHGCSGHRRNFEAEGEQLSQDELYISYIYIYHILSHILYHYIYIYIGIIALQWTEIHWNYWLDILDMEAFHYLSLPSEAEGNTLSHVEHIGTCSSHLSTRSHVKHLAQPRSFTSHSPTCIFNWGWARVQYVSHNFGAVQAVPSPSSRLGAATPARDSPSSAACILHTERCEMRRESWTGHEAFGESSDAKLGVLKWLRMHCNNIPWASFPANQTVDHGNTCFPQLQTLDASVMGWNQLEINIACSMDAAWI